MSSFQITANQLSAILSVRARWDPSTPLAETLASLTVPSARDHGKEAKRESGRASAADNPPGTPPVAPPAQCADSRSDDLKLLFPLSRSARLQSRLFMLQQCPATPPLPPDAARHPRHRCGRHRRSRRRREHPGGRSTLMTRQPPPGKHRSTRERRVVLVIRSGGVRAASNA
jgi:hypothetical protein